MTTITLPGSAEVGELFAMLFGTAAEVDVVERDSDTRWLGLYLFTTPDDEPVAFLGADIPIIAFAGAALAGYPADHAEEAIAKGRINGELWDNFAEVGNVVTTLLVGDRFPRVLLHNSRRMSQRDWVQLLAADLPSSTMRVAMDGYGTGTLTFIALTDAPAGSVPLGLADTSPPEVVGPDDRWRPYSFRRPSGVSRDLLRALHIPVGELARSMAGACNASLNSPIHQRVLQFHHATWDDYAAGITTPALFISFQLEPLDGRFLLSWPVDLAMALVDLMLGGSGEPLASARVPSDLDHALVRDLFARALAEVPSLFAPYAPVAVTDVRVDLDAKLFQGASFRNSFLVLWMSTEVAGIEYQSSLGLPVTAVQPFTDAILGRGQDVVEEETHPALRRKLLDVPVEVRVGFRPLSVPATRLAGLRAGDVIALDPTVDEPLHLACGAIELAAVEPVVDGERLLVQITRETIDRRAGIGRFAHAMHSEPGHERELATSA